MHSYVEIGHRILHSSQSTRGATRRASAGGRPSSRRKCSTRDRRQESGNPLHRDRGGQHATLGDDGLTLPIAGGVSVALPRVVQVDNLGPNAPGTLHVIREDGTEAMVDLTTGDVLFEVPPFENWTRGIGQWRFVPTDATLTAWNVTDMTTGETRLLSDLIDLPGDGAVMPSGVSSIFANGASVFQLELGRPENTGFVSTDPAARTSRRRGAR